jgi:hypothetical protein
MACDGWCSNQNVQIESLVARMPEVVQPTCRSMLKSAWPFILIDDEEHVIYPCKGWIKGSHILHLLDCLLNDKWDKAEDITLFASLLIRSDFHVSSSS